MCICVCGTQLVWAPLHTYARAHPRGVAWPLTNAASKVSSQLYCACTHHKALQALSAQHAICGVTQPSASTTTSPSCGSHASLKLGSWAALLSYFSTSCHAVVKLWRLVRVLQSCNVGKLVCAIVLLCCDWPMFGVIDDTAWLRITFSAIALALLWRGFLWSLLWLWKRVWLSGCAWVSLCSSAWLLAVTLGLLSLAV